MRYSLKLMAAVVAMVPVLAIAAPFDPDAATNALLATVNGAARAKSDAYFEGGYWLILWGALMAIAGELIILHFGLSARFRDWAERTTKRHWLHGALYIIPYTLVGVLIGLPWMIYTQYFREKHYDLLSQSFGAWGFDQLKGLVIGIILGMIIITLIFAVIRRFPKSWWLWGAGVFTAFTAFGAMVAPVYIAPLFNTYTEMQAGPLRDRIVAMAAANNVPADHIYVFDASKQSKRISANVSGLGPTIRISLNDNLLNRTTPDQVVGVMGHELGHYVLGHVFKTIAIFALIFLFAFWMLYWITPRIINRYGARWGVRGVDDVAVVPLFSIIISLLFLVLTPLTNTLIRTHELEADAFGLDAARQPDAEAQVMLSLSEYRKLDPGPIEEFIFFDHPSGRTRIQMAMDWKAAHLAEIEARGK